MFAPLRLVERNAPGIRLTDAGEALVRHAYVRLARLADAEAIARFHERHSGVEVTLTPAEPPQGLAMLRSVEVDTTSRW